MEQNRQTGNHNNEGDQGDQGPVQDAPDAPDASEVRGDPRMNRAVEIRLNNPNVSLSDALRMGGFEYPPRATASVVDSENVALGQRKNQLNRRLRQARLARAAALERRSAAQTQTGAMKSPPMTCSGLPSASCAGAALGMGAAAMGSNLNGWRPGPQDPLPGSRKRPPSALSSSSAAPGAQQDRKRAAAASSGDNNAPNPVNYNYTNAGNHTNATSPSANPSQAPQILHMQSLQQAPPPHLVGQQQQPQPQQPTPNSNPASDLLQQLTNNLMQSQQVQQQSSQQTQDPLPDIQTILRQAPQQANMTVPPNQLQALLSQLPQQSSITVQPQSPQQNVSAPLQQQLQSILSQIILQPQQQQQVAVATTAQPQPVPMANNNGSSANMNQVILYLPLAQDATQQQHLSSPAAIGTSSNVGSYNVAGTTVSSLQSTLSSHPSSANSSDVEAVASSAGQQQLWHNSSQPPNITQQQAPTANVLSATASLPAAAGTSHVNSNSVLDQRLNAALQTFDRDIRRLYEGAMLGAGFSIGDSQETSLPYQQFAFECWRRECTRLQETLHRSSTNATSNDNAAATSVASSVGVETAEESGEMAKDDEGSEQSVTYPSSEKNTAV
ncbi:expressed unknown protein [Seminavis robusta]|uniref:Uncharacterized protein n=1 Tax=Seminavis robusta TaxID=568900 RepID=A0A9N8HYR4_9STRA|nr:expressed unknown protein [Seminavis robusta]|eukprot:Sro2612_g332590.1 n/a (612) ;mRNA; f:1267-3288